MRILLVLLAIVAVVLAILMEQVWLYVASGLLLAVAVGLLAWNAWQSHRKTQAAFEKSASDQDDLNALGIVEIREKQRRDNASSPPREVPEQQVAEEPPATEDEPKAPSRPKNGQAQAGEASVQDPAAVEEPAPEPQPAAAAEKPKASAEQAPAPKQQSDEPDSAGDQRTVLHPYLQALKAAVGAHTACLLVQEEVALTYRIEALVSDNPRVRSIGESFSSRVPLLTANLSRQKAALRDVGGQDLPREGLGYYRPPLPAVEQIALAPVPRPDSPASFFLLLDKTDCFAERKTRRLLARFADLLAILLDVADHDLARVGSEKKKAEGREERTETPQASDSSDAAPAEKDRLPRWQIIEEEMAQARAEERELALTLVYLNRAETVAARGEEAVQEAERQLRHRLEEVAAESRVEHFGELTYGIFYEGDVTEAEDWAVRLQRELEDEAPPLEGGVSVGLAMLRERHEDPDALRADATEALREAYTTGTCTILE